MWFQTKFDPNQIAHSVSCKGLYYTPELGKEFNIKLRLVEI